MDYLTDSSLPPGFQLRSYLGTDYPEVESFWNSNGLGGKHRGDTREVIAATLAGGAHLLLLTDPAGKIAGTSWMTNDKRRTYLHHFGIAQEWRGKGLSKLLLRESFRLAVADGYQLKIEVHRNNEVALNLYKKAGFSYLGDYDVYIIRELPEQF